MTIQEIRSEVAKAIAGNLPLQIEGYVSSTGAVTDQTVRIIGPTGYREMVQQAIDMHAEHKFQKPDDVSEDVWDIALEEQVISWEKTLSGSHETSQWGEGYTQNPAGYYDKAGEDVVYIKNLQQLEERFVSSSEKVVKSAPKTLCKKAIVGQSPLAAYVAVLKLSPDKVTLVQAVL